MVEVSRLELELAPCHSAVIPLDYTPELVEIRGLEPRLLRCERSALPITQYPQTGGRSGGCSRSCCVSHSRISGLLIAQECLHIPDGRSRPPSNAPLQPFEPPVISPTANSWAQGVCVLIECLHKDMQMEPLSGLAPDSLGYRPSTSLYMLQGQEDRGGIPDSSTRIFGGSRPCIWDTLWVRTPTC